MARTLKRTSWKAPERRISNSFLSELEYEVLEPTFHQLCLLADSPFSLGCWLLFKNREFLQLVSVEVDQSLLSYVGRAYQFALDHQVASFLRKYRGFTLDIDKEQLAYEKFNAAEESCRVTNEKFRILWSGTEVPFSALAIDALRIASRKVRSILGNFNDDALRDSCRFGPGSDLSTKGSDTALYDKFSNSGSATPWVLGILDDVFSEDRIQDFAHECELVRGNRLSFVPKTALVHRSICVEPRWNMFIQLGIGTMIGDRLLRCGVDLRDQSRNQEAAQRAYFDGLATVDLSSASDTISKNLVLELLGDSDWSDLIFKSRSPCTLYKDVWRQNEKISSMGNGYTFPLESLIFYGLAYAACCISESQEDIVVFGDDIILPRTAFDTFRILLTEFGFSVNEKKSFKEGNFFESCGADYYQGMNVRPIFLKDPVTSVMDAFKLANSIVQWGLRLSLLDEVCDPAVLPVWRSVINSIHKDLRLWGPINAGVGVLHVPFDKCRPQRARFGWEGWTFMAYSFSPVRIRGYNYEGHLFSKLFRDVDSGDYVVRRSLGRWIRKRVYVPTYTGFCWG